MTFPVYNTKWNKPVALDREAGKEIKETLANFRKLRAKVEIKNFLQAQESKNTQYNTKSY